MDVWTRGCKRDTLYTHVVGDHCCWRIAFHGRAISNSPPERSHIPSRNRAACSFGHDPTDAERKAFLSLARDDERDQFIEQFWQQRNPEPGSPDTHNSFKEEHYRRIAYANEHFTKDMPGWQSDRGRVYITWGPPDEIQMGPSERNGRRVGRYGGIDISKAWERMSNSNLSIRSRGLSAKHSTGISRDANGYASGSAK